MRPAATATFVLLLVLAAGQAAWFWPQLPETVASHFDGSDRPDAWSSRGEFFAVHGGVLVLTALVFLGLPRVIGRLPNSLINLPNKRYWLAPERRRESLDHLARQLHWFGAASTALVIYVVQIVIDTNISSEYQLSDTMVWALVLYGLFVIVWLVKLLSRFGRVPQEARSGPSGGRQA